MKCFTLNFLEIESKKDRKFGPIVITNLKNCNKIMFCIACILSLMYRKLSYNKGYTPKKKYVYSQLYFHTP